MLGAKPPDLDRVTLSRCYTPAPIERHGSHAEREDARSAGSVVHRVVEDLPGLADAAEVV